MNLQQLEYFKVIAETKNFTTASNMLSVTQPALSKAISNLEQELEVSLFEREGRSIKITSFGNVFLEYASKALDEIERGKEALHHMKENKDNIISIVSTYCVGAAFMPFLISNFLSENLDVKFNINNESDEKILNDLNHGKVDFGFIDKIEGIENNPKLIYELVKRLEYVLIVPKNHKLAKVKEIELKDLAEENFIWYGSNRHNNKLSYYELMGYNPKIVAEPNEASLLSGLVSAGVGIAIVPYTQSINMSTISIVKIKDDIGFKNIYMVWNKEEYFSIVKEKFKKYAMNIDK